MFPSPLFMDLVDAHVAFRIASDSAEISVSRAKSGLVLVDIGKAKRSVDASEANAVINGVLGRMINDHSATFDETVMMDGGSGLHFEVIPEKAAGSRNGFAVSYQIYSHVLNSSYPHEEGHALLEIQIKGEKPKLYEMMTFSGSMYEIVRVSRRAPTAPALMSAITGGSWMGSPSAEELFIELHGEDGLDRALLMGEARHSEWMGLLSAGRRGRGR